MHKSILFEGTKIRYAIDGEGDALLFLHGYLESMEIWEGFAEQFSGRFRVLCMDIPGHGESGILGQSHNMDMMARAVASVLDAEGIHQVVVIGHSMGGYVTLEFAHLYPERTRGYVLFHSTCFADNEEKKLNRDREISLVMCGKKMQIIHTNIPKAFADDNLEKMKMEVTKAKEIAVRSSDEGIIALLQGMKNRKDHTELLSANDPKALVIWGKKDNYIVPEVYQKLRDVAPNTEFLVLINSGHMGFMEEPEAAFQGLLNYIETL